MAKTTQAIKPIFTVDLEEYWHGIWPGQELYEELGSRIRPPTYFLLRMLAKYEVKAIFYVVGQVKRYHPDLMMDITRAGHLIGDHSEDHSHGVSGSGLFRSPFWDCTPMPGFSGGFFFRAFPLTFIIHNVKKHGVFWIHPHDLDRHHPTLRNPLLDWKRHVGLCDVRSRLEDLLQAVPFGEPSQD